MNASFRSAERPGDGVSCDETGLFVGDAPLLAREGVGGWEPRPLAELNAALGARYGLPVDLAGKAGGLGAVARALDAGDLARAGIAALHLRLPDPPDLAKAARTDTEIADLAWRLQASGMLAKTFDDTKHPRWPAKTPNSIGGQFSPAGSGADAAGEIGPLAGAPPPAAQRAPGPKTPPSSPSRRPRPLSPDAGNFAATSSQLVAHHFPLLQAAVIGSDGSISYAAGGSRPDDYEGKNVAQIAPRGTIPMRDPAS